MNLRGFNRLSSSSDSLKTKSSFAPLMLERKEENKFGWRNDENIPNSNLQLGSEKRKENGTVNTLLVYATH